MNSLARYALSVYLIFFTLGFTVYFTVLYMNYGKIPPTDLTIVLCNISLTLLAAGMIKNEINEA